MSDSFDIIRVFPRRTKATPVDSMAFVGDPPLAFMRPANREVHVSCTFSWDLPEARRLAASWGKHYNRVFLNGPALGHEGYHFTSGMYLKSGYVITSRGCPNRCTKCLVPGREGRLRVLPIEQGYDICDNNLLACPRTHIEKVLGMLGHQRERARFTGGLEAKRVTPWFVRALSEVRLDVAHTAYDRPEQAEHVERAVKMIQDAHGWVPGTSRRKLGCFVLMGHAGDTIAEAAKRLEWVRSLDVRPFPMFWQPNGPTRRDEPKAWKEMMRPYRRPSIAYSKEAPNA